MVAARIDSGQWTADSGQRWGPRLEACASLRAVLARFNRGTTPHIATGKSQRANFRDAAFAFVIAALLGAACFAAGFKAGTHHGDAESTEKSMGDGFKAGGTGGDTPGKGVPHGAPAKDTATTLVVRPRPRGAAGRRPPGRAACDITPT